MVTRRSVTEEEFNRLLHEMIPTARKRFTDLPLAPDPADVRLVAEYCYNTLNLMAQDWNDAERAYHKTRLDTRVAARRLLAALKEAK